MFSLHRVVKQLFSTMNSENVLQRYHLPRKSNERVRPY
ncbi:hypothetical protein T12_11526 [Trichinella patagoniensis]|uniref:Uncharacterized protein n=1 Tax=Trichinella patagoniensis TaxID=990121 RepID=A0A0V0YT10_9BILA|nr:hypothetical protein T12_11526 [Trichinella patagoniensis]